MYSALNLEVLTAANTVADFIAPNISGVEVIGSADALKFRVRVGDESGEVTRVVILYLHTGTTQWSKVELTYDPLTGFAEGTTNDSVTGNIAFFIQAADRAGNVALALDHGNPFVAFASGGAVPPSAITNPATNVTATSATLNGTVNANGSPTSVQFQLTTTSGNYSNPTVVAATPASVSGTSDTAVSGTAKPNP